MNYQKINCDFGNFVNTVQYKPFQLGTTISDSIGYPNVVYNGVVYRYNSAGTPVTPATNPATYKTPDTDASAEVLYALGGGTSTNVLSANLTGFSPANSKITTTSSLLQYINNNSYVISAQTNFTSATNLSNSNVALDQTLNKGLINCTLGVNFVTVAPGNRYKLVAEVYVIPTGTPTATLGFTCDTGKNALIVDSGANNSNVGSVTSLPSGLTAGESFRFPLFTGILDTTASTTNVSVGLTASGVTGTVAITDVSSFYVDKI